MPNREYYTIPSSGGLGKETFAKIGLCVIFMGLLILTFKKIKERKEGK